MIDIEKVLISLDLPLTAQRGDEVQGYCPMHKERTGKEDHNPSWWINSETGAHICFSCGYKGNIYTLISDIKGIDYFDARDFVNQQQEVSPDSLLKRIKELPQYVEPDDPIGMSEARLAVFTDVPDKELRKRFLTKEAAHVYGVRWDSKNESWILPIRSPEDGSLWGWQEKGANGRFFKNQPTGVKKSKTIFGVEVINPSLMIVVESPLDAVRISSIDQYSAIYGVATFGAIISEDQAKLMRRSEKVIAAFDNDDAGKKASEQMLGFARKYGMELSYFNYQGIEVKDVGDMTNAEVIRGIETAKDRIYGKAAYGA